MLLSLPWQSRLFPLGGVTVQNGRDANELWCDVGMKINGLVAKSMGRRRMVMIGRVLEKFWRDENGDELDCEWIQWHQTEPLQAKWQGEMR